LIEGLIAETTVIGVQSKEDKFVYDLLRSSAELRLDYDVTILPPKKYFLRPAEILLRFDGEKYEAEFDDEEFVLVGVHPYDMTAINQMDKLYSEDNFDSHYMRRRENATIIACDVARASENVFASSMGTATVSEGFDILLTDIGDFYVAEAATDKGEKLLVNAEGVSTADDEDLKAREKIQEENKKNLNKHKLGCKPSELSGLLEKAYNHPIWEELGKKCFSCGSCNQVCPTCYCFNVQDEVSWDLKSGTRKRVWDGCLLDGFTKVAGGHEFRGSRADRIRHRIYRKGKYVPEKIGGEIACVGCGRCVGACLTDIANPVKIYNRLIEDIGIGK